MLDVIQRGYQDEAGAAAVAAWRRGYRRIAVVIPTQGGKTVAAFNTVLSEYHDGQRFMFIVNQRKIVQQTAESIDTLLDGAVDVGIVMGQQKDLDAPIIVGTVQTICRCLPAIKSHGPINYLIVDEGHHAGNDKRYQKIINDLNAKTLFITATIEQRHRLDKLGVKLAYHVPDSRLVREGVLAKTEVKYLPIKDNATAFKTWNQMRQPGRTIIFVKSVNDARFMAQYFRTAGAWNTVAVDANSSPDTKSFAESKADVIITKGMYLEGADLKQIGNVMILATNKEATPFVQKVGRAKKADGTGCLVIANSLAVKKLPTEVVPALERI